MHLDRRTQTMSNLGNASVQNVLGRSLEAKGPADFFGEFEDKKTLPIENRLHSLLGEKNGWTDRALCLQTYPESFFPEKGGSTHEAKKICARCEVKDLCLTSALRNDERFGIWGGLSERERRRLKRDSGASLAPRELPNSTVVRSEPSQDEAECPETEADELSIPLREVFENEEFIFLGVSTAQCGPKPPPSERPYVRPQCMSLEKRRSALSDALDTNFADHSGGLVLNFVTIPSLGQLLGFIRYPGEPVATQLETFITREVDAGRLIAVRNQQSNWEITGYRYEHGQADCTPRRLLAEDRMPTVWPAQPANVVDEEPAIKRRLTKRPKTSLGKAASPTIRPVLLELPVIASAPPRFVHNTQTQLSQPRIAATRSTDISALAACLEATLSADTGDLSLSAFKPNLPDPPPPLDDVSIPVMALAKARTVHPREGTHPRSNRATNAAYGGSSPTAVIAWFEQAKSQFGYSAVRSGEKFVELITNSSKEEAACNARLLWGFLSVITYAYSDQNMTLHSA
jgi:WhiB family redox-sensing transcriptional regulator